MRNIHKAYLFLPTYLLLSSISLSCDNKENNGKEKIHQSIIAPRADTLKPLADESDSSLYETEKYAVSLELNHKKENWKREIELPTTGKFTEESHYVTYLDTFSYSLWPQTKSENIAAHLKRSYDYYNQFDSTKPFSSLYKNYWQKEWTPEEGGHFGQGSTGEKQLKILKPEHELWLLNMMWAPRKRPPPNTKFLLEANNKKVVVLAGFETGPMNKFFLGGVTREVHGWLGTNNTSDIKISYLKNQNLPAGPIRITK
jgi:hypothetical protein